MVWFEVLGWGGSAVLVWSILQGRVLRLRAWGLLGSVLLVAYNGLIQVWPMVAMNAVIAGINSYHLVRLVRTRHDDAAYEVVRVGPRDEYVAYLLSRHRDDIERFNPGFRWEGDTPGDQALLVLRGTETVGIVLLHDLGGGVAEVRLDYVLPRYRDFTPGEFVYCRSRMLADMGFRRVLAPPHMREAEGYLRRVGFRREGDREVLDLPVAA